jgi:hypothetical protein
VIHASLARGGVGLAPDLTVDVHVDGAASRATLTDFTFTEISPRLDTYDLELKASGGNCGGATAVEA